MLTSFANLWSHTRRHGLRRRLFMKAYQRLIVILLVSLFVSCLLCPVVFSLIRAIGSLSPRLSEALDFPFDRVMRRVVLVVTLLALFLDRRRLNIRSLASMGLARRPGWGSLLARGWLLGVGSLSLMLLVMFFMSNRAVEPDYSGAWELVTGVASAFIAGAVVGLIEEVFFRGFVLRSFLADLGGAAAVFWTSVFYAIVHFFNAADLPAPAGFAPLYGFKALAYFFQPLLSPAEWIPGFIGLLLVGVVLAVACIRSRSLYLAIGLHAGWVFAIKGEGLFLSRINRHTAEWFFGGGEVVTGVFGWIMLLAMLLVVRRITRAPVE